MGSCNLALLAITFPRNYFQGKFSAVTMTKMPFILLLSIILIHSTEGAPSDYFKDLRSQGDQFINQVSGWGSEVGQAGNRFVDNVSNEISKIRDQGRRSRVDVEARGGEDRDRFYGGRCIYDSQCAYITLRGNTNLQVSSCDKSYIKDHGTGLCVPGNWVVISFLCAALLFLCCCCGCLCCCCKKRRR